MVSCKTPPAVVAVAGLRGHSREIAAGEGSGTEGGGRPLAGDSGTGTGDCERDGVSGRQQLEMTGVSVPKLPPEKKKFFFANRKNFSHTTIA